MVINPGNEPDQDPRAKAPVTRFVSEKNRTFAIADLTAAFAKSAARTQRGIALIGLQTLVQHELKAREPERGFSFIHTAAEVSCDGATATITLGGRSFAARILQPAGATSRVMPAHPLRTSPQPERQRVKGPNPRGVRKLAIEVETAADLTLAVLLTPDASTATPVVRPLAAWQNMAAHTGFEPVYQP